MISEALLGVIIGGAFGFLGALIGILANLWLESRRANEARVNELRKRLVGDHPQLSDAMRFILLQRKRRWPFFWKLEQPDLSLADLKGISFSSQDLSDVIFYRADLSHTDLEHTNLTGANLSKATLRKADLRYANLIGANLEGADLSDANLAGAIVTPAQLAQAHSLKGAILPADVGADSSQISN